MSEREHEHPKVSVVIAAYNHAAYLPMAVESVLGQTFLDYEIIVVNDGSTDDTDTVMQSYVSHKKVRYYTKPNGGQASAKNYGIRAARGEYIAFLDADDIWVETKLVKQIERFEKNRDVGVVYSDITTISPDGLEIPFENPERFRGKVLAHLYGNNFVPFPSSVTRRDILEEHGGFDESLSMGIDYDLWLRLSLVTEFDFVAEKLVHYRVGHKQMSKDVDGRDYWARLIEKRFRERHPLCVTPLMIKQCQFGAAFTRFRTLEMTDRAEALKAIIRMFSVYPFARVAWKSLIRFIMGSLHILGSRGKTSGWAVSE